MPQDQSSHSCNPNRTSLVDQRDREAYQSVRRTRNSVAVEIGPDAFCPITRGPATVVSSTSAGSG